jgi:adenine-specific DNA-methyltransferase
MELAMYATTTQGGAGAVDCPPLPENQIIQGDCTAVLKTFPDASVDLVLTDPPYGVRYRDRSGRSIAGDIDPAGVLAGFSDVYRVLKPDS